MNIAAEKVNSIDGTRQPGKETKLCTRKESTQPGTAAWSEKGHCHPDPMAIYMRQLGGFPVAGAQEQLELARRYQDLGDQEAACQLILSNLRLVVKIAMKYRRKWMNNNLDLIQEGNIGLMKALKKFDPYRGIKFSYYASFWIKAYIMIYIVENWRLVKIGSSQAQRSLFYNLGRERQRLEALGVKPDPETISRNLEVPEIDVVEMGQHLGSFDLSLDMTYSENSDLTPRDVIPATGHEVEVVFLKKETAGIIRKKINELLPLLSYRERDIINLRLMADAPLTLGKIGEMHDITRERVRQIEAKLLGKIKTHIQNELKDFSAEWIEDS